MNKAGLVAQLAPHFGDNKAAAGRALEAVLAAVADQLAQGERVSINGFGVFEPVHRPERNVRNPATGSTKRAEETYVVRFRPGQELKDRVADLVHAPRRTS